MKKLKILFEKYEGWLLIMLAIMGILAYFFVQKINQL